VGLNKKTVRDIDVKGKRVLVRCDFNVPLQDGEITDDRRITSAQPTIQHLIEQGATVILCSHLGRPKGGPEAKYSLLPVATRLSQLLAKSVPLLPDCIGPDVEAMCASFGPGDVALLENVRFHAAEEANDPSFARQLASLADLYVNDAFGTAHRAHASTEGVAHILPGVAGFLIEKEIEFLGRALDNPTRPFVAFMGGAKVADKIKIIDSLLPKVDKLAIGGGMMFTFLKAQGHEIGTSLLDADGLDFCRTLLADHGDKIALPTDVVVAPKFAADAPPTTVSVSSIPADQMGLDIGPDTQSEYQRLARTAGTVIWNGPMGVFETPAFAEGTRVVAEALTKVDGLSVVGGGDSAAAVRTLGFDEDAFGHISTGGGASLEYLEGKELPGISVLQD